MFKFLAKVVEFALKLFDYLTRKKSPSEVIDIKSKKLQRRINTLRNRLARKEGDEKVAKDLRRVLIELDLHRQRVRRKKRSDPGE